MGAKEEKASKKVFNFYYDLYCQKLTVYPGTPANEIIASLRELLQIAPEAKLEYRDEEGLPIVISSALPNDIKIHVKIKKTFTEKFIESSSKNKNDNKQKEQPTSIEWFWLASDSEETHKRKNNNKTIYQPINERSALCKGDLVIDSGEYYYTIIFEPLQCCVFASICNSEAGYEDIDKNDINENEINENKVEWLNFWALWPDYPDPHDNFPGPVINAGFYVNMSKKLLVIYDAGKEKEIKRVNFNESWKKVSPIVNFKHEVSITVSSKAIKGRPSFIKLN